ncbi:hypothetical protein Sme01_25510 [Sphaerisporangium melleum]|uniref:Methyltransferase domain-containing protein n=1 Tax=Sphaerisporangium melleum TaxID=321316 RepID=A0A917QR68_9ACTN|nr:class I SAM-dependent methyltransferase [Sphaerisporangium melleum]GGK64459.1 hypothetical protein GCM10007964_04420 [Sphaerisporangium melleum]GII70075.1 hypothetical protein Sme01_25510 [Sphaerisporangium melleum]
MSGDIHVKDDEGEVERFWEAHYGARDQVWSGRPNAVLVDVAGPLPPGRALDLGCGEGGDAVWLAGHGWRVTATDISAIALSRAAARAQEAGVLDRIDFQRHDFNRWLPEGSFDLVSAQFMQSPVKLSDAEVLSAAARTVVPGGLLLIVNHGSVPPWAGDHHDHRFPTPEETFAPLRLEPGLWDVEILERRERLAIGPDGTSAPILDNVIAVRRRPS